MPKKDSLLLMTVYKQYLEITADLVTILERHYKDIDRDTSKELKIKYQEFRNHAHKLIEKFNEDMHILLKIDWELKEIEDKEK